MGASGTTTSGQGICLDSQDNVYTFGYSDGEIDRQVNSGFLDFLVAGYSSTGTKRFTYESGGTLNDRLYTGVCDNTNKVIYAGGSIQSAMYKDQVIPLPTSSILAYTVGEENLTFKNLTTHSSAPLGSNDRIRTMVFDSQMNIIMAGESMQSVMGATKNNGMVDMMIIKRSPGNKYTKWARLEGGDMYDTATGLCVDENDNIYMVGNAQSKTISGDSTPMMDPFNIAIYKFDKNGNRIFAKVVGGSMIDEGNSIAYFNQYIFVAGSTASTDFPYAAKTSFSRCGLLMVYDVYGGHVQTSTYCPDLTYGYLAFTAISMTTDKIYLMGNAQGPVANMPADASMNPNCIVIGVSYTIVRNPPTISPTAMPTYTVTESPTFAPSTSAPTLQPSVAPTLEPSVFPTLPPSSVPTLYPSDGPTLTPSVLPTTTNAPSDYPSCIPTVPPTSTAPSMEQTTLSPTIAPSGSVSPSSMPVSATPSMVPSQSIPPTKPPTQFPTRPPTKKPTPGLSVMTTSQTVSGISYSTYLKAQTANDAALKNTIAKTTGESTSSISGLTVTAARRRLTDTSFRAELTASDPAIEVSYTISSSSMSYDILSTTLKNKIASGEFDTLLIVNSDDIGGTFAGVTTSAVVTREGSGNDETTTTSSNDDDSTYSTMIPLLIAVIVLLILVLVILIGLLIYICFFRDRNNLVARRIVVPSG